MKESGCMHIHIKNQANTFSKRYSYPLLCTSPHPTHTHTHHTYLQMVGSSCTYPDSWSGRGGHNTRALFHPPSPGSENQTSPEKTKHLPVQVLKITPVQRKQNTTLSWFWKITPVQRKLNPSLPRFWNITPVQKKLNTSLPRFWKSNHFREN